MRALLLADAVDAALAEAFRGRFPSAERLAATFYPAGASEAPPAEGGRLLPAAGFFDPSAADALDALALAVARDWHAASGDRFRAEGFFLPHHYEVPVLFEAVDFLRHLHLADRALGETGPAAAAIPSSARPAVREAAALACARRKVPLGTLETPREASPFEGGGSRWKRGLRRICMRARLSRERLKGEGPFLLWAYPKVRHSGLLALLRAQGARFAILAGEEPFWEKGIPYRRILPEATCRERWEAGFEGLPLPFAWEGGDLAPPLRRLLAGLLAGRFAASAGYAAALARGRLEADAVVTPDFLDGLGGLAHDWAEVRGIPRIGIQHGAPLCDYWLHLRASWTRGTLLAWDGPASAAFFRGHLPRGTAVERAGSPDNDRFAAGFRRSGRPDLLLCTLSGFPYTTVRVSHEMNERIVADLLAAAEGAGGIEVVFKPHPLQGMSERRFLARLIARHRRSPARLAEGESIDALLARARILATRFSSTAVEAGLAGIPVLHLDYALDGHPWYTGFLRDAAIPRGKDAAGLREALQGILADEGAASRAARAFALAWESDGARGAERAAAAILSAARSAKVGH